MPTYLTDVFGFNMQVAVRPDVVAVAAAMALVVGIAATVGALASARGSIAEQLGRSPQAGATVTSTISLRSALALLGRRGGLPGPGAAARRRRPLPARRGDDPGRPRPRHARASSAWSRSPSAVASTAGSKAVILVARGAVEANPRRAALAAAIMALGVAAVVPPQLAEHSLVERTELLNGSIRPGARQLLAADDAFASVPITTRFARRALRDATTVARPTAFAFVPYRGPKDRGAGVRAEHARRHHPRRAGRAAPRSCRPCASTPTAS